jgi:cytochrome c oxidase cbb3-type subunit 1
MYGFFSMMMFGAYYFALPRLTGREWASPALIRVHFWGSAAGILAYFAALTLGGVQQGLMLLDPSTPFLDVVAATLPWLEARSWAGAAMTVAHLAFTANVVLMFTRPVAVASSEPTLLAAK